MSSDSSDDSLLEVIPAHQLTPEQVAHWRSRHTTPTYRLRREPKTLYELESYGRKVAIWMNNETLVHVSQNGNYHAYGPMKNHLRLMYSLNSPERTTTIAISGNSDDAIADTAMFWWGLHCPEKCNPSMEIYNYSSSFDFVVAETKHLAALFTNNQKRHVKLSYVTLNVAQLVFLATRNHPIDLIFGSGVYLVDGGDAFVDALQTRESQFGSLHFGGGLPLRNRNIERLVRLNLFEELELPIWESGMALLPLSSSARTLTYTIDSSQVLLVADVHSLDIFAKELTITVKVDNWADRMDFIVSLLGRLSHFDHFTSLALKFDYSYGTSVQPDSAQRILKELVRTIEANQGLESLNLETWHVLREHCLKDLLESCGDHKGLRNVKIEVDREDFDFFDYPWFKRVLSRNRRIEVRGSWMDTMADKQEIDEFYSFNRFYHGSGSLKEVSQSDRTTLIGTALTEKASGNFQRSALLMASYTDSLCEFIQYVSMDSLTEICMQSQISDDSLLEAIPAWQLTQEQVARWRGKHNTPTHKLRREPRTLYELESYGRMLSIWMNNATLVQVSRNENYPAWRHMEKFLRSTFYLDNPKRKMTITISGKTDDAIADTAMFWWGLHCPDECNPSITADNRFNKFDYGALKAKHLVTLFVNNQKRRVTFSGVTLNAAQSVVLVTRNHPIDLTLSYFVDLIDGGDAFVNALRTRKTQFGSLCIGENVPLRMSNIKRLVQMRMFTKLTLPACHSDITLLPFSAPVKTLEYKFDTTHVRVRDIQSFDISAEELIVTIQGEEWTDGIDVAVSFLGRLATFHHFKHIGVEFDFRYEADIEAFAQRILKELVRMIAANQELESVDLDMKHVFKEHQVKDLLESCGDHKGLRNINVEIYPEERDSFDYPWFKQLLSRNRRMKVSSTFINFGVQQEIGELYALNRFYNGSESLSEVSQSDRTMLIGTALAENASRDFQRSALLIANHTGTFCELIQSSTDADERNSAFLFLFLYDIYQRLLLWALTWVSR